MVVSYLTMKQVMFFCGSKSCIDLKLPKSWREKQKEKQSKQDQIIEMLGDIQSGSIIMNNSNATQQVVSTPVEEKQKNPRKKLSLKRTKQLLKIKKPDKKEENVIRKKSLCEASGGMQLGGTKMKLKKTL